MKRTLFLLISLYMGLVGASAQSNKYDLNEDGDVNVTDVTLLVSKILAQNEESGYDLNDDEDVNITDVILMVNYILNQNDNLICPNSNHPHMIDLGLPSGTKWACCNVGATKPEEYGGYYAWGETEEKDVYTEVTYLYLTGVDINGDGMYDDEIFYQDLGEISGTKYDVAHVKWGGKWCMPTSDDIQELIDNCSSERTTLKNVNGYDVNGCKLTGPNGNSIILPATGGRYDSGLFGDGTYGCYWSSTQFWTENFAYAFSFGGGGDASWGVALREGGRSVRPVSK